MSERELRPLRQLTEVSVDRLRNIGEKRRAALESLGITTVFDLLTLYPRRYIDRTRQADLSDLSVGDEAAVYGEVRAIAKKTTRQGRVLVEATVVADGENLKVTFFGQPWRVTQLPVGVAALFFGKVGDYRGTRQMVNPVVDVIVGASGDERDPSRVGRVVAIYPASGKAGLTSWEMGGFVEESLRRAGPLLDPVPAPVLATHDLVDRTAAFQGIHVPAELEDVGPARRRLAFDELLRLQLLLALRREHMARTASGVRHPISLDDVTVRPGEVVDPSSSLVRRFLAGHRFAWTGAQQRVLAEIAHDLAGPLPMHRLLQGDVGSGKTIVALTAMLAAVHGGRQAALMAPTEVLAEQHVAALRADLAALTVPDEAVLGGTRPLRLELLSARVKGRERERIINGLLDGSVDIVVGTHALLTDAVRFAALGVVVIDEQHRFGVEQRASLRDAGRLRSLDEVDPDVLVMTATPIPRTAAMVVFGDLDLSVLDERPAGRRPITTTWEPDPSAPSTWEVVRREVAAGHRAFVVCPLVDESDRVEAASAQAERTRLATNELRGLSVGLVTGQMSSAEKDEAMRAFRAGEIQVLVATVVIEVGIDVPEATVIVIEDAARFGLAQLHQLRGRVGRSDRPGYCVLLGPAPTPDAATRLQALVDSDDGFALAEIDLDLRGEGTLLGARQRGRSDLRLASLRRDGELLVIAQGVAKDLVAAGRDAWLDLADELRLFVDDEEAAYLFAS